MASRGIVSPMNTEGPHNLISPVSPAYYAKWKIEPISFILHNDLGFAEGNIIKYIMRHRDKGGAKDLDKAMRYIEMLKEAHYGSKAE